MPSEAGERLRQARETAGFASASAAAKRFGWPVSTYLSHENGQTPELRKEVAEKYARAFKASAIWLMTGEGDMRPVAAKTAKDRLEKAARSVPEALQSEAIRYLEFLAARRGR